MNKRSAPRFPVTLDVDVTFPSADVETCTIRDYCSGGMYLLCQGQDEPADRARFGDRVSIEFEDPLAEASRRYHIEARVVRFEGQGVGVAFTEANAQMLVALSQLAASQSVGGSGVAGSVIAGETYGDKTVAQLISHIQTRSQVYLDAILQEFFKKAPDALFDAAGEAKSNIQQSAYFGAMNELRTGSEKLRAAFEESFKAQFEALSTPGFRNRYQQEAATQGGLSLVESDELDNWLAVRAISSRLEESLGETLEALETRLEEVSANPINLENNPVGPFLIVSIFREMLNQLVLEEESRKLLFSVMESGLAEKLKVLYDELNEAMIAQGILPTIQKTMEVVKKPGDEGGGSVVSTPSTGQENQQEVGASTPSGGAAHTPAAPAAAVAAEQATQLHYTRGSSSQPSSPSTPTNATAASAQPSNPEGMGTEEQTTQLHYTRPASAPTSNAAIRANTASAQPSNSEATAAPPQATQLSYSRASAPHSSSPATPHMTPSPAHAVHELVQMQPSFRAEGAAQLPPPAGYYNSDHLVNALNQIDQAIVQHDSAQGSSIDRVGYIEQALSSALGIEGMALSEDDKETVTYVGGMFSSIHEDALVAEQARPWFRQLEVPLLKAGLLDGTLQEDVNHPARELLNRLESVGDLIQNDDSAPAQEARQRIETILQGVGDKVESEPDVFVDALKDLTEVQESVEENYEKNITKLIQQCEQEKVLDKARRTILDGLNRRLGRQEVPLLVLNLLDSGWKNLLLRTLLKEGADSAAFQGYLNVIDRLAARLTGQTTHMAEAVMPDDELLEWIARMLKMVSSNEQRNEQLLDEIVEGLSADDSDRIETRYVPALISKAVAHQHKVDAYKPKEISDDVWSLMLEDARQPVEREVFLFRGDDTDGTQVHFIWQDEGRRFVFADNRGHKALDLELGEVASALYNKNLIRINEKELSITERATYSFLQSLHNQIAYQANHDSLTGLLNRKSFGQELEKAIDEAKSGKATHVLGYFDLDRFNLINTTCGHAEGDVLLGKVATVLAENTGEEEIVARLGGDEFGIILRNTGRSGGLKQLTGIHDSIRDIRFACENNEFKVTCSMGVTEINESSDSPGRLLSAVDSAAFTAKDNGRDNIQIYNMENQRISDRQDILGWVGRINVLFDKNLIKLRCQKISPLHKTINSLPHYEVLLDVQDEDGNKVPLEEFIVAAERYNRILDIDKWVVNYIFDWLEEHKSKLDRISNLSVNLSGVSLGNRHFIDQLHERLSRPDFPAQKLCFEVTETIAMNDLDTSARFMRKLKETGCLFSLDDFGSGTSSYAYLRSLPIDYIKIDGAFIKDIATNTDDYAVVKSINEIGHVMGKQTVAEGVENDFAYQLLHDIGVDFVQGFGVEKPIPLYRLFS